MAFSRYNNLETGGGGHLANLSIQIQKVSPENPAQNEAEQGEL
jgi:hypothetical protein